MHLSVPLNITGRECGGDVPDEFDPADGIVFDLATLRKTLRDRGYREAELTLGLWGNGRVYATIYPNGMLSGGSQAETFASVVAALNWLNHKIRAFVDQRSYDAWFDVNHPMNRKD